MKNIKNESVWMGALIAGTLALLLGLGVIYIQNPIVQSASGIVLCCGIPFVGAFVTIWHYTNTNGTKLNSGDGAGLGALALAMGAFMSGLLSWLLQLLGITPSQAELWARQKAQITETYRNQGMTDEQIELAIQSAEKYMQMLGHPLIGMATNVVVFALMGAVCGAIVAAMYKPKANGS